jgi:hypothetical protein
MAATGLPTAPQPADDATVEEERRRLIAANRLAPEEERHLQNNANTRPPQPARIPAADKTPEPAILAAANPAEQGAMKAQYAVQQQEVAEDEGFINIGGAKINKQKLRGVFRAVGRKVSRTFDKSDVAAADNTSGRLR